MNISVVFITISVLSLQGTGCRNETMAIQNFDPSGKMLFIEDMDGKGGLLSFDFGDIVIFDPINKKKIRLTNDKYYDNHPYWSADGQKVIFESKRIDNTGDGIFDLTDATHLFILDISSGQIEQFDEDFDKIYAGKIGKQNLKPAWSPNSKQIAFVTKVSYKEKIVIIDLVSSSVLSLTEPGDYRNIDKLRWSANGKYLGFDFHIRGALTEKGVAILDISSKQVQMVSDANKSCETSGWANQDQRLLFDCFVPNGEEAGFFQYSLDSKKVSQVRQFLQVGGFQGQFNINDDEIAFIGGNEPISAYDIFLYDISNDNFTKLTKDGHNKTGLIWYFRAKTL